jgi:Aminopeptidase C
MKSYYLPIACFFLSISLLANSQQTEKGGISSEMLQQIKQSYQGTSTDKAIRNAICNNDINKLAINIDNKNNFDTYFSHKINSTGITDQKSSGRYWLFKGLNVFRAQVLPNMIWEIFNLLKSILNLGQLEKPTSYYKESSIPEKKL